MMKGEAPFDARAGMMALTTIYNASLGMVGLFPEDSDGHAMSAAAPDIWMNTEGFEATLA